MDEEKYTQQREKIAELLYRAMKEKGMTYESLGERIGKAKGNTRNLVRDSNLTIKSLMELCHHLGLEITIGPK